MCYEELVELVDDDVEGVVVLDELVDDEVEGVVVLCGVPDCCMTMLKELLCLKKLSMMKSKV